MTPAEAVERLQGVLAHLGWCAPSSNTPTRSRTTRHCSTYRGRCSITYRHGTGGPAQGYQGVSTSHSWQIAKTAARGRSAAKGISPRVGDTNFEMAAVFVDGMRASDRGNPRAGHGIWLATLRAKRR